MTSLFSGLDSSRRALASLGNAIAVHANNIANVNTEGFRAESPVINEIGRGGSDEVSGYSPTRDASGSRPSSTPEGLDDIEENRPTGSDVDLVTEFTSLQSLSLAYRANLKVVKIIGSLLDDIV